MKGSKSNLLNYEGKPNSRKRGFVKRLYSLFFLPLFFYLSFYGLRRLEYGVTFHPERHAANQSWDMPEGAEEVWFSTQGDRRLNGLFINSGIRPATATVIFFHGNGGNLSYLGGLGENLAQRGFDVLLFDYRGYGRSEGEIVGEADIYADADAAYHYVVNERAVSPEQIVLYGQSLGTTAATDLASRKPCKGIILESGLSSASNLASTMLPWLPDWLHGFSRNRFDSASKLANVHCPVLITHGDPDRTIPTEHGRALFAAANEPKKILLVAGADHCVFGFGGAQYMDEIAAFVRQSIARKT